MNDYPRTQPRRAPRVSNAARAFTLVEMLIVIGIILLLTSLTVMTVAGFNRSSEIQRTQGVMTILGSALKEWELNADRTLTYGKPDEPNGGESYDVDQADIEDGPHFDETIFILVGVLERSQASRELLANIDTEYLLRMDDPHTAAIEVGEDEKELGVRDAWDNPIRVVFPGRLFDDSVNAENYAFDENDKTIQTAMETMHGIAVNRLMYFVSAGPDGKWGHLHLDIASADLSDTERDEVELAADNVYSYDVLRMRPTP